MNKQIFKGLATVLVVSIPLQFFALGGMSKPGQIRVSGVDRALSINALENALSNLKLTRDVDQTLTAKNRKHLLSYVKKLRNHPDQDHKSVLKFKNERDIAKVIDNSFNDLRAAGASDETLNRFLDLSAGHISNYNKPRELKKLHKQLRKIQPSRSTEAKKSKKTDPTIDKWRNETTSKKNRRTSGLAGQLPNENKPLDVTKTSKALPVKKAQAGSLKNVKPLNKTAAAPSTRPHHYKKSPQQVEKEKEERAEKRAEEVEKRKSIREKREEKLKKLKALKNA